MEELVRKFRNATLITLISSIVIAVCLVISSLLVTISISDPSSMIFTGDIASDSKHYLKHFIHWWAQWWEYKSEITLDYNNYFVVKLFVFTFAPILILGTLIFAFRAPLMDWRPYKKKESIHGDAKWASEKEIRKAGLREKKRDASRKRH